MKAHIAVLIAEIRRMVDSKQEVIDRIGISTSKSQKICHPVSKGKVKFSGPGWSRLPAGSQGPGRWW